jgi:hypothetical protein
MTQTRSRPLVQWIHRANPYLLESITREGPIGAIGVSILDAPRLDATIAAATARGLGTIVDTEPYRVQLEPEHPYRSSGYRAAGLEWLPERFSPERMILSADSRNELLSLHRDAQAAAGATVFYWSGHHVHDSAPLSTARRQEVGFAADFLALAQASGATHPAPDSGLPRRVAVGLTVESKEMNQRVIGELVSAYSQLEPDVFWINCVNFSASAEQYRALRYLARHLQRESGVRCLLAGLGALWEGALRNQVAAACQGWGRGHLSYPPAPPPPPAHGEERGAAYGVPAFHPAIRSAIGLGQRFEAAAQRLYQLHPCPCGHHPQSSQPEGQRERHLHNRYWAEMLAEAAVAGEPSRTTEALGPAIDAAEALRQELELSRLPRAWQCASSNPSDGERLTISPELWLPQAI